MADNNEMGELFSSSNQSENDMGELFAPAPAPEQSTKATISKGLADYLYNNWGALGKTVAAMGYSAKQEWDSVSPKLPDWADKELTKAGVYNDYQNHKTNVVKGFNESFLRPAINGGLTAIIGGGLAAGSAIGAGLSTFGGELAQEGSNLAKSFEAADQVRQNAEQHYLGFSIPNPVTGAIGEASDILGESTNGGFLPEAAMHMPDELPAPYAAARSEGAIGETENHYFGLADETAANTYERKQALAQLPANEDVHPVHEVARRLAPEVFDEYDNLSELKDNLRDSISYVRSQMEGDINRDITVLLSKTGGDEELLSAGDKKKLDSLREDLDSVPTTDIPHITDLRNRLVEADQRQRDLAPQVSDAYAEADRITRLQAAARSTDWPVWGDMERVPLGEEPAGQAPESQAKPAPLTSNDIADDVSMKLQRAGRSADEANAAAALIQSHYEARANRFKGRLGTPEELYAKEGPEIIAAVNKGDTQEGRSFNQYVGMNSVLPGSEADKMLDKAQEMLNEGKSSDEIRKATGWFKNPFDNRMRYEISDKEAELTKGFSDLPGAKPLEETTSIPLGEALKHDKLFDVYPDLKNVKITKTSPLFDFWKAYQGWFDDKTNTINVTPYAKDPLSTILHEVQHWVQSKEGFARGGNAEQVVEKLPKDKVETLFRQTIQTVQETNKLAADSINKLINLKHDFDWKTGIELAKRENELWKAFKAAPEKSEQAESFHKDWLSARKERSEFDDQWAQTWFGVNHAWEIKDPVDRDVRFAISRVLNSGDEGQIQKSIDDAKKKVLDTQKLLTSLQSGDIESLKKALPQTRAHQLYEAIAGEIEARDVQARQKYSEEERREAAPYSSQTYNPEDVTVSYEQRKGVRKGSLTLRSGKNLIKLFEKADASTFLHETGHQWLEEIKQDAAHPEAPTDLQNDWKTVRTWLGNKGEELTRAQHERFARGFEKYLMEGRAPTSRLAEIFGKFKQWLTDIYKQVSNIGTVKINDDIRGVFDRLSATEANGGKSIIAPEKPTDIRPSAGTKLAKDITEAATGPQQEQKPQQPVNTKLAAGEAPEGKETISPEGQPKSATDTFSPRESKKFVDSSGKIDFKQIGSNQDLIDAMREYIDLNKGSLEIARGRMSKQDIIDLADAFGANPNKMDEVQNNLQKMFQDTPLSSSTYATKTALIQASQEVKKAVASKDPIAYAEARTNLVNMLKTFVGVRAEWGRTGIALQMGADEASKAQRLSEYLENSTGKTLNQIEEEMKRLELYQSPKQINRFIRKAAKPSLGDMLQELFVNGLISGPFTHLPYLFGQELYNLYKVVAVNPVRALITAAHEKISPQTMEYREHAGTLADSAYAFLWGHQQGFKAAWNAFKAGASQGAPLDSLAAIKTDAEIKLGYTQPADREARIKDLTINPTEAMKQLAGSPQNLFTKTRAIPNLQVGPVPIPLGSLARAPGERMVAPIHSIHYTVALTTRLAENISRVARNSVEADMKAGYIPQSGYTDAVSKKMAELYNDTPDELIRQAKDEATEDSLMSHNKDFGRRWASLVNWETHIPLLGDTKPLRFIDPFVSVAANVFRLGLENSPFGLLMKHVRADLSGENGQFAQDTAIAKVTVGTAFYGAIGSMMMDGSANGPAPADYKEAVVHQMVHGLPHSIRIGDMSYDMSRLGPIGLNFALATNLWQFAEDMTGDDKAKAAIGLVTSTGELFTQEGPISGFADLLKAKDDPARYGSSWGNNFAASFTPYSVGLQQTAQRIDPYQRVAHTYLQDVEKKVPFKSEDLTAKIDLFGQPVPNKEFRGVYATRVSSDPVWQALENVGYFPAPVKKDINGVKLTDAQYEQYAMIAGQKTYSILAPQVQSEWFQNSSAGLKHEIVKNAFESGRAFAGATLKADISNGIMNTTIDNKRKMLQ